MKEKIHIPPYIYFHWPFYWRILKAPPANPRTYIYLPYSGSVRSVSMVFIFSNYPPSLKKFLIQISNGGQHFRRASGSCPVHPLHTCAHIPPSKVFIKVDSFHVKLSKKVNGVNYKLPVDKSVQECPPFTDVPRSHLHTKI